jgi:hypothetical protein
MKHYAWQLGYVLLHLGDAMTEFTGKFLRVATLKKWDRFHRFQNIDPSDFVTNGTSRSWVRSVVPLFGQIIIQSNFKMKDVVHFVSHRWDSLTHPDPQGEQLTQIISEFPDDALIWYDYSCLPQEPRTKREDEMYLAAMQDVPKLIAQSWFTVVGREIESYDTRTWCQFEAICAAHYNTGPKIPPIQGEVRKSNEQTDWCLGHSPLHKVLVECMSALPKDRAEYSPYVGGFHLEVPDLDDGGFVDFKSAFFDLQASKSGDPALLWETLRKLFPARRDDYTYTKY